MKTFPKQIGLLALVAFAGFSSSALAADYDLTYTAATSDNTLASGQITVVDGTATAGSLDITAGPDAGLYTLVPGSGSDSYFIYDNVVTPDSDSAFLDSTGGLLWSVSGSMGNSAEINLWYNPSPEWGAPADTFSMWGADSGYNLESYGTATLAAVPSPGFAPPPLPSAADGGWTASLLGGALFGLQLMRRKLTR